MHVREETFHSIFLSPGEMGQARVEVRELTEEHEIDWKQYPTLDRLTDAICTPEAATEI